MRVIKAARSIYAEILNAIYRVHTGMGKAYNTMERGNQDAKCFTHHHFGDVKKMHRKRIWGKYAEILTAVTPGCQDYGESLLS